MRFTSAVLLVALLAIFIAADAQESKNTPKSPAPPQTKVQSKQDVPASKVAAPTPKVEAKSTPKPKSQPKPEVRRRRYRRARTTIRVSGE